MPNGALLYSALVHCHRSSASTSRLKSLGRFYGSEAVSRANWFGAGAGRVSSDYFAGALSPNDVLCRHTLFGFYALGLSEERANEWSSELILGSARGSTRFTRTNNIVAVRSGLRWCPICASNERNESGFSTWWVVHQLPFVLMCPTHSVPLCVHCHRCRSPLDDTRTFRLPGEACTVCGSCEFEPVDLPKSPAYYSLIRRSAAAIELRDPTYQPKNWSAIAAEFLSRFNSPSSAQNTLQERLCSMWAVNSIELIGAAIGVPLKKTFPDELIQGGLASNPLVAQIIVMDAFESVCPDICGDAAHVSAGTSMSDGNISQRITWAENYQRQALKLGLPRAFSEHFTTSLSTAESASAAGVSVRRANLMHEKIRMSIRTEFGRDSPLLQNPSTARGRFSAPVSVDVRRVIYRARITKAIDMTPKPCRTALWARNAVAMGWLHTNDRAWLDAVVPSKRARRS